MKSQRTSGILLHPTSLPGPHGIGELGPDAVRFVDALCRMGQFYWQILPLGPTGYGNSPYQSSSTFAGNTLLISFDRLVEDGLLQRAELDAFPALPAGRIPFGKVIPAREEILGWAAANFDERATPHMREAMHAFCEQQASWLDDYALYAAIKRAHELKPWTKWPRPLAGRDPSALKAAGERLADPVRREKILQFLFHEHWNRLHAYCHQRGVRIVGDLPIFVAHDSADVWAHPELFLLDDRGRLLVQAGVPPDYFSETGQLWGNPLYRWDIHRETGYAWWLRRMRAILDRVDVVRIDHFRGFEAHWEVPGNAQTAKNGRWVKGPGGDLFEVLRTALEDLPIIAEDLGVITAEVEALRDRFGLPGMRILQFAFGNDPQARTFRPESFPANCVAYTGTHDNDTSVGWFHSEPGSGSTRTAEELERERRAITRYFGTDGTDIQWSMIADVLNSRANTAIIPLQDILGLGTQARMNQPGTREGNWEWRFTWDMLTTALVERLNGLTVESGRA